MIKAYITLIVCLLCGGQVMQAQFKEMTGRIVFGEYKGKVHVQRKYDRAGHLLSEEYPTTYCTRTWAYDGQGRVLEAETTCGESSANGIEIFRYEGNKIFRSEERAVVVVKAEAEVDEAGRILVERQCVTDYSGSEPDGVEECKTYRYVYQGANLVYRVSGPPGQKPDHLLVFVYNAADSLTDEIFLDVGTGEVESHLQWRYSRETEGKATTESRKFYAWQEGEPELISQRTHHQEPGKEWLETILYDDDKPVNRELIHLSAHRPQLQEEFDATGQLYQKVEFEYTEW